jgi:hypothetical protein
MAKGIITIVLLWMDEMDGSDIGVMEPTKTSPSLNEQ